MEVLAVILSIIAVFALKGLYDKKADRRKLLYKVNRTFGQVPDKTYSEEKKKSLRYYFNTHKNSHSIDNITWNDLDLDQIYMTINSCFSAFGEEYLYNLLRNPEVSQEKLLERKRVIDIFTNNRALREKYSLLFAKMGTMSKISVFEYMNSLKNATLDSASTHVLQALLLVGSIVYIFFNPPVGIAATIVMFFVNIFTYFKRKSQIENYFIIVGYIIKLLDSAGELTKDRDEELESYTDRIRECLKSFRGMRFGASIVTNVNSSGDLIQLLLDYLRMSFHIDLIKFFSMYKTFLNKEKEFCEIFDIIGFLDSMLAIVSFRELMEDYCEPVLVDSSEHSKEIIATGLYHPMLDEPVPCSFKTDGSVLLTGSNASGKSTYIKTVAINQILAQTIYTVLAQEYTSTYFDVMSSMALRDSIESGESYYIVEIKSLKRIIDRMNDDIPLLIFIDEVLRGTNTLERIAASAQILYTLATSKSVCFAATHDIELTFILEKYYSNYHFEEKVEDNMVMFDYKLHEGRAVTKNAIKLLSMLGYNGEIIDNATAMANDYLSNNEWKVFD